MEQNNPYSMPQVALVDEYLPQSLEGWTSGRLQLLGWLSLVSVLGTVVLLALSIAGEIGGDKTLKDYLDWLSVALLLLGNYLLIRFKAFAEVRFLASGLAWPIWSVVAVSIVMEVLSLVIDEAEFGKFGWQALLFFGAIALYGAAIVWLGVRLLKVENVYPAFRVMAWFEIVGGVMAASVILILVAVLPMLGASVALMLVFFKGATELRLNQGGR